VVCRTNSPDKRSAPRSRCERIHGARTKFHRVPEGHWYLRVREGKRLGACWEREGRAQHDRCRVVRVKTGRATMVRWPRAQLLG
jgi:hypothetical protein